MYNLLSVIVNLRILNVFLHSIRLFLRKFRNIGLVFHVYNELLASQSLELELWESHGPVRYRVQTFKLAIETLILCGVTYRLVSLLGT